MTYLNHNKENDKMTKVAKRYGIFGGRKLAFSLLAVGILCCGAAFAATRHPACGLR